MPPDVSQFYRRTSAARKIIVVDLGFLGDSVHLVPALWEIQRHYPGAELHTLSAPVGRDALSLVPAVRRAWAFPLGPKSPAWWRHWDVLLDLRREKFDVAFNFSGADRTLFITAFTGARWRVAHRGARRHFWSRWLIDHWVPRRGLDEPVFEQRRQVLAACGFKLEPARWTLQIPEASIERAAALLPKDGIHLSINASTPLKEWPLEHWAELARTLLARGSGTHLVATGSAAPREQERLCALAKAVADQRLVILPADLSIADLAAALQRCALHVGADSGVLHLAVALGLPTVALFRDYPARTEWLPRGEKHRHLLAPCPCLDLKRPPCAAQARAACLSAISPSQVLPAVEAVRHSIHG